ncbi:MAG TPA: hypothetical protein VHM31_24780 [Polyangia bacterium]|nr:hypothetical protein [Polyangia bacterium]
MSKATIKQTFVPLVIVLGLAACSSSGGTGGTGGSSGATGGASGVTGGASGTGSGGHTAATGGAGGSAQTGSGGAVTATGGAGGAASLTLADACTHNCSLAAGLTGCSTTMDVCVQSCLKTFDNTSAINSVLGTKYTKMMVCIATDPKFASAADFVCAKPNRALNQWSPGPDSNCEPLICDWNCSDGTTGNFDPFIDIRCSCSSV